MIEPNQTRLDEFDDAIEHREIIHRGQLDEKRVTNTRMIVMNVNGFRCQHEEKIDQIKDFSRTTK